MTEQPRTPRCILITGPGHSATRLLVQMLARHPQVLVPLDGLNSVSEWTPLRQSFRLMLDRMSLADTDYPIDRAELGLLINAYRQRCGHQRPFFVLKEPFFPLICLEEMLALLGEDTVLLYNQRPAAKIVRSFIARGEHQDLRRDQSGMLLRKAKRLSLESRREWLESLDPVDYFERYVRRCDSLRSAWNERQPQHPLRSVEVEQLSSSEAYLRRLLSEIGLDPAAATAMRAVIDQPRLLQAPGRRWLKPLQGRLRGFAARIARS